VPTCGIAESIVAGTVHTVIIVPKQAVRKHLPAIAGLKIFAPSPPKTILPIIIAKPEPIIQTQNGMLGGSEKARMMPVTTALKSPSEFGFFLARLQTASKATQEMTQLARTIPARILKKTSEAIIAGTRPMITSSMTLCVE
jgi:hypothetical protein